MPLDPSTSSGQALATALRRHLLQRFPADRAYPRSTLHSDGMPPLVAVFLDRTLDRWTEIERDQLRSDWFDFDEADVQQAEDRFFAALGRTARVPADAWKGTLGGTVDLVVRFLTTPARALTDAIFEGSPDPLPTDEVRARLSMFDAYPYFPEVAGAYLDRKQPDTLDPAALFDLLDRIDRRVVSDYEPDDWVTLLAPLFDLTRRVPEFDGIPTSLLQRFFEAKGETALAERLGEHVGTALDEATLRTLLVRQNQGSENAEDQGVKDGEREESETAALAEPRSSTAPNVAVAPDEAVEEDETESTTASEGIPPPEVPSHEARVTPGDERRDTAEPGAVTSGETAPTETERAETIETDESSESDDEPVPLWQRFAQRTSGDTNVNARFGDDAPANGAPLAAEPSDTPLWKRFFVRPDEKPSPLPSTPASDSLPRSSDKPPRAPSTEPLAPAPEPGRTASPRAESLEALEKRVLGTSTSGQRTRFVKHLFGGDAGKYATVLHALDAAGSWTEASQIIARDVFRPFRVNIYNEHAVAFTDAVEARFRT